MTYNFQRNYNHKKFFKNLFELDTDKNLSKNTLEAIYSVIYPNQEVATRQKIVNRKTSLSEIMLCFIMDTQLLLLNQPDAVKEIMLQKQLESLLVILKIAYKDRFKEDTSSQENEDFFNYISEVTRTSIVWQYNEDVIKNYIINYSVYNALIEERHPSPIVNEKRKGIEVHLRKINNTRHQNQLALNEDCWQEIKEKAEQKYFSMTQLQLPWKQISVFAVGFAAALAAGAPLVLNVGVLAAGVAWVGYQLINHPNRLLTKETERQLIKEASEKNYITDLEPNTLKNKRFLDKLNNNQKQLLFREIVKKKLNAYFQAACLKKRVIREGNQVHTVYARADIIEAAQQPATTASGSEQIGAYRYLVKEMGLSPRQIKDLKTARDYSEELLPAEDFPRTEVFQWGYLSSIMGMILPLHAKSGGLQFIGLATETLKQQMQEQGIKNPDGLLDAFLKEYQRVAEGKTEHFKKFINLQSKRPVQFGKGKIEPGKFERELGIRRSSGEGLARVYFHTATDATGRATLYYGCWFDAKGLHTEQSKRKFAAARNLIIISEADLPADTSQPDNEEEQEVAAAVSNF